MGSTSGSRAAWGVATVTQCIACSIPLVNDSFGDPGLYVDFRDQRRALLFDLGDVSGLPPRRLMRLSHVFVTHAHMDHFAGFDHLLRVVLGRKAQIVLVGGPGFVAQVEHKLRAYTWNVVHRYEVPLLIEARELGVDGEGACARFSSRSGFEREPDAPFNIAAAGDVLHDETAFRVRARFVDHDTPCLAYAIEEKLRVGIDNDRLLAQGLAAGAWLGRLKHALLTGLPDDTPLDVQWRDRQGEHATRRALGSCGRWSSTSPRAESWATSPTCATRRRTSSRWCSCWPVSTSSTSRVSSSTPTRNTARASTT